MCGIGLLVQDADADWSVALQAISAALAPRGPDGVGHITRTVNGLRFLLVGSLLHLRGERTLQPVEDALGNALCWNGEIFGGDVAVPEGTNDTRVLLDALKNLDGPEIIALFARIEGPWAFVYWQERTKTLWFGRDPFGRRSLLLVKRQPAPPSAPAGAGALSAVVLPAAASPIVAIAAATSSVAVSATASSVPPPTPAPEPAERFLLSSVGVLGLDDAQAAEELEVAHLYNYCFTTRMTVSHPRWPFPTPNPLFVRRARFEPTPADMENAQAGIRVCAAELLRVLTDAVRVRVTGLPLQRRVGVLFSGGLDSSILAVLTHRLTPPSVPIDLLNVAFGEDPSIVPDRITGLAALQELRALAPDRQWRLITDEHMSRIRKAMHPCTTVMDYTLACAFYFASRGIGNLITQGTVVAETKHRSDVAVLLMGNGADEQLAGYGRHKTRFTRGGWASLQEELERDTQRLWTRNLGRDDRIVSQFGREVRQPFLAEPVIRHINTIPLWHICDLRQRRGVGDKQVLREVALLLGLRETSAFPKRAVQFGSRIKNLISPKSPGTAHLDRGDLEDD